MTSVAFITLGCKTNQFETQAMELICRNRGLAIVGENEIADIYIVNSCAVTANAGKKSRQELHAARRRNPTALIAVCGCYSEMVGEELLISGDADIVSGNKDHTAFLDAILEKRREFVTDAEKSPGFENLPAGNLAGRTRALLKIEDGCTNYCAYCIIPYLRGRVRSIDPAFAESEVRRLSSEGFREIVLTGIEIASYGQDLPEKPTLADLILRLSAAAEQTRLRLGSLEPRTVTEDFCRKLAPLQNLCPHFHLSLQAGCDTVLKRMGRRYDTALFEEVVDRLRRYFPHAAITTDIITGFPGETEDEFRQTCDFCRKIRFDKVHVFPYSIRTGTRAARMDHQIPRTEKERRARELGCLTAVIARDVIQNEIGREAVVLFESEENGSTAGYTENYHLFTYPASGLTSRLARVQIERITDAGLTGRILSFIGEDQSN